MSTYINTYQDTKVKEKGIEKNRELVTEKIKNKMQE